MAKPELSELHPLRLSEALANHLSVHTEPWMGKVNVDVLVLLHYAYCLVALLTLHVSAAHLSLLPLLLVAFVLSVGHVIFSRSIAKRRGLNTKGADEPLLPNLDCSKKQKRVSFACRLPQPTSGTSSPRLVRADNQRVSVEALQPGTSWINKLLEALWLKQRHFWRQRILEQIWPMIKSKMGADDDASSLQIDIIDLNLGDKPPRITGIDSFVEGDDLALDLSMVYSGNATVTLKVRPPHLRVRMPSVTLYDFMISNLKVRVVLKHLKPRIPFASGILFTLLETPVLNWDASGVGKVAELPVLNAWIKSKIGKELDARFVLPNRLNFPFNLPLKFRRVLDELRLRYDPKPNVNLELPDVAGELQVWINRAENLRDSDFGFGHYCSPSSKSLINPFNPSKFTVSELLPRMGKGNPYVRVSVGKAEQRSPTVSHVNDVAVFQFKCQFMLEKCLMERIVVDIFDDDLFADDPLARVSWRIDDIRKRRFVKGWFNSELNDGRILMRFEWKPILKANHAKKSDNNRNKANERVVSGLSDGNVVKKSNGEEGGQSAHRGKELNNDISHEGNQIEQNNVAKVKKSDGDMSEAKKSNAISN